MKTVQDWFDIAVINPNCFGEESVKKWITAIQADAFADGERKGRVQQLREIASRPDVRSSLGRIFIQIADRLEREEKAA